MSTDTLLRRRNRDLTKKMAPSVGDLSGSDGSVAARVLAQFSVWLRFPKALEAQFQAQALEPRRKLALFCGVIGLVSLCLGTIDLRAMISDVPELAIRNLYLIVGFTLLVHAMCLVTPKRWRRAWQSDAASALPLLAVNAALIHDLTVTHADTAFTLSASMVSTLMFGCIAARMRFSWSLACAITSFTAYVVLVKGHTPLQVLIVDATIGLMLVSYPFALVANYLFEHSERRNWLLRMVEAKQRDDLGETSKRLHLASIQDPLTQLFNRRQFDVDLAQAWSKAMFSKGPVALLMVDVDFFKRYNDSYGHPAGDACLVKVSQILSEVASQHGGIAARLGGEEFGLLLPGTDLAQAMVVGEALCEQVRALGIAHAASDVGSHVTVSVGATHAWPAASGQQALLDRADQALYQAKASGRDRVCAMPAPEEAEPAAPLTMAPQVQSQTGQAADVVSLPSSPELVYTQILRGGFRRLRFPKEQEAEFRNHEGDQRRTFLAIMAVLGIVIYNVYMLCNRAMFTDIQDGVLLLQAGLGVALVLLTVVIYTKDMPVLWREGLFSLGVAVMAVSTSWLLSQSQQMTAIAFSVSLVLIPMFSGVAARQPFWFTCVPALVTCVMVALVLQPAGAQQTLVFKNSVTMIITNTVFTLILSYTLEHGARKAWLLSQIERLQGQALQAATRRLHELSMRDPLTGICNRRQFEEDLQGLWGECRSARQPLAMLVVDVDFFKLFNDGYGHPVGDQCLKQVAMALSQTARACHGRAARLGGEEFGILLPRAHADQALALGEQLCTAVRELKLEHLYSRVPGMSVVTVSVGVASVNPAQLAKPDALMPLADDALYQAKRSGRNRAVSLAQGKAQGLEGVVAA